MYKFLLIVHVIVVISLLAIILIQRGRSGGLVEALGGVESIFGTKTSNLLVKATVILAVLFFFTSISLAYLSGQRSKSLLETVPMVEKEVKEKAVPLSEAELDAVNDTAEPAPDVNESAQ